MGGKPLGLPPGPENVDGCLGTRVDFAFTDFVACRNSALSAVRKLAEPRDEGYNLDSHALGAEHHFIAGRHFAVSAEQ